MAARSETGLGLGEVHRAGPSAGHHVGRKVAFSSSRAVVGDRLDRAQREHLAQGEGEMLADFHISSTAVDTVTGNPWPPNSVERRHAVPAGLADSLWRETSFGRRRW